MSNDITLRKVRLEKNIQDSFFLDVYGKLIYRDTSLTEEQKFYLLKLALYFLNSEDVNIQRLGYRIILMYSNLFGDYNPLYDVALNLEYIPITKFIENKHFLSDHLLESFSNLYLSAFQENFKIDGDGKDLYRSKGQMSLNSFSNTDGNIAIVAPTSYGKSEMIFRKIVVNLDKKICILVPSKALLAQTKKALLKNETIKNHFKKIITHPDMFKSGIHPFLAVLTQERLQILLRKNKELYMDLVLVDEAHNLLEDESRAHLLAQVLLILQKRKSDYTVNFFTPFLVEVKNLNVFNHKIEIKGNPLDENMKVERYYAYDNELKKMFLYDQFLDRIFEYHMDNSFDTDIDFILHHKSAKNIIYLNRPVHAEEVAMKMAPLQPRIILTPQIQKVIESISELISPSYNLIECIKSGIVYHHGGIPDIIRLYIEDIFSKYPEFNFIVTTSTLLEGVNIPAEKIFLLTPVKTPGYLSASQFKNLIGRVCRFREVFSIESGDLRMLEPEIYLIKGHYSREDFALMSFYKERVNSSKKIEDSVDNPLLTNSSNETDRQKNLEYLENMEPGSSGLVDVVQPESIIGRLCFENNVSDFNIIKNESILSSNLTVFTTTHNEMIKTPKALLSAIGSIFFFGITLANNTDNIARLQEEKTKNFYEMFIAWRMKGSPYPLMINNFLHYWKGREEERDPIIYVGSKWGDEVRDGHKKLFVNISQKNETQRVNLAIAKIKEEQEFVDFNIMKYIEILNELGLIDDDFYDQVKYGTSDKKVICMLKNGLSMELAKLFKEKYLSFVTFDLEQDTLQFNLDIINKMKEVEENEILIFEAMSNL
ncbi:MAG: DEAD/DEAH box helicase [Patescibacteria group bacterium]